MENHRISDGHGTVATILPEKGATVVSLQKGGKEFLCCDEKTSALRSVPGAAFPSSSPFSGG